MEAIVPAESAPWVCVYEDRLTHVPGVLLLLASLARHQPDWPVLLRFPGASEGLRQWCRAHPAVQLLTDPIEGAGSYNIKPQVLLDGLARGARRCVWLDTDTVVTGPLGGCLDGPDALLVSTLDPWGGGQGSTLRCKPFGLTPGRTLEGPVNSAVVSVTARHTALLERWRTLLRLPHYLEQQGRAVSVRHPLMLGDQDALSALLASEEGAAVPLHLLRSPTEVLHHHGAGALTPAGRRAVRRAGRPPLVLHAMGSTKPWLMAAPGGLWRRPRAAYERLYLETSPYLAEARSLARDAGLTPTDPAHWLRIATWPGRLLMALSGRDPWRAGWLQSALHDAARRWRG